MSNLDIQNETIRRLKAAVAAQAHQLKYATVYPARVASMYPPASHPRVPKDPLHTCVCGREKGAGEL